MKKIKLNVLTRDKKNSKKFYALVDDEDFEYLNEFNWTARSQERKSMDNVIYAERHGENAEGKRTTIFMHREIMKAIPGQIIDHINHNGLLNIKANLRFCTPKENIYNMRPMSGGTSKFKGVSWNKRTGRWRVKIAHNGQPIWLGQGFKSEIEAGKIYDAGAFISYKEFAYLNFGKPSLEYIEKTKSIIEKVLNRQYGSEYKGISLEDGKWRVTITIANKKYSFGRYDNENKAYEIVKYAKNLLKGEKNKVNMDLVTKLDRMVVSNSLNGKKYKNPGSSSKYWGVMWHKRNEQWNAFIHIGKKQKHLGTFKTEKQAALAYNRKATELLGSNAKLNIMEDK